MGALRTIRILVLGALIGGGFYLLLIDITTLPELCALAGVAIGCGIVFTLAREQRLAEARLSPRSLPAVWRVIVRIPPDIARLCREAVAQAVAPRSTRGTFRVAKFGATSGDPEAVGRRAVTEWIGSVPPNTIVVGVDADRGLLLVHQLRRQGDARQLDPLGLG
jgi:hypothetical protein